MTRMLFSVDKQHRSDVIEESPVEEWNESESEVCDEEEFVNDPKDPFQKKYRK